MLKGAGLGGAVSAAAIGSSGDWARMRGGGGAAAWLGAGRRGAAKAGAGLAVHEAVAG